MSRALPHRHYDRRGVPYPGASVSRSTEPQQTLETLVVGFPLCFAHQPVQRARHYFLTLFLFLSQGWDRHASNMRGVGTVQEWLWLHGLTIPFWWTKKGLGSLDICEKKGLKACQWPAQDCANDTTDTVGYTLKHIISTKDRGTWPGAGSGNKTLSRCADGLQPQLPRTPSASKRSKSYPKDAVTRQKGAKGGQPWTGSRPGGPGPRAVKSSDPPIARRSRPLRLILCLPICRPLQSFCRLFLQPPWWAGTWQDGWVQAVRNWREYCRMWVGLALETTWGHLHRPHRFVYALIFCWLLVGYFLNCKPWP